MFHIREPYTVSLAAAPAAPVVVGVGFDVDVSEIVAGAGAHPRPRGSTTASLSVGAEPGVEMTRGQRVAAAIFLLPFLAGPPLVGYYLLGTIGAVAGTLWAAPAIYFYVAGLTDGGPTITVKREGA